MATEEFTRTMLLSVENNLQGLEQTLNSYLLSNITAGGTALPVRNINSFTNQYAVQVGKTGEEQSEITIISTPSGTILPLNSGTLKYDHPIDTPVYAIHYDSIIFKRSTAGTSGTATGIATVSITPDSLFTEYNDTSGATTYAYKTQYYNSVSNDVSSESDWFIPSGPTYYSLIKIRQRGKDALYNANYIKSDSVIDDWINEWVELMTNAAIKVNQAYSVGTCNIAFGTAGLGTVTDASFKQPLKVEVAFNSGNYQNSTEIPVYQWSANDTFSSLYPRHYWIGDNVFGVLPLGIQGTAAFTFSKRNTPLVNDTDELPFSLRSYTTSCVDYILHRAYGNDNKHDVAAIYYNKYLAAESKFQNEVTPRDQSGFKTIEFVEELSGNDMFVDYF